MESLMELSSKASKHLRGSILPDLDKSWDGLQSFAPLTRTDFFFLFFFIGLGEGGGGSDRQAFF